MLRFLESMPLICVQGHSNAVVITLTYDEPDGSDGAYQYESFKKVAPACTQLNDAYLAFQQAGIGAE